MSDPLYLLLAECVRGKGPEDYVFTRENGRRVKDFRRAWWNLCVQVGLGHWECRMCGKTVKGKCCDSRELKYVGLTGHDFRRSAARSHRRAGVAESVIMKMCGWETRTMFERYNITDSKDVAEAVTLREQKRIAERDSEIGHEIGHDSPVFAKRAEGKKTVKAAN